MDPNDIHKLVENISFMIDTQKSHNEPRQERSGAGPQYTPEL